MTHIDVTTASFEREVLERSRSVPVLVDFWAPWCGPCRTLGPVLEALASEAAGAWVLAKVNTDEHQELARRFGITGIPAVKAFRDGELVDAFVGALPEGRVRAFVAGVVPTPAARAAASALIAARSGEGDRAAALFAEALESDPTQPDALLHLAQAASDGADPERALELLARLTARDRLARSSDAARVELAVAARGASSVAPAARLALDGQCAEAIALLLPHVARDVRDVHARATLFTVFDHLGPDHPLAADARTRLAKELLA